MARYIAPRLFVTNTVRGRKWRLYRGQFGGGNTFVGTIEKTGQEGRHGEYRLTIGQSIAAKPDPMAGVSWTVFGGNMPDAAKQLATREGAPPQPEETT